MNELGEVLDGVDIVMWGRGDEPYSRCGHSVLCDVVRDLEAR